MELSYMLKMMFLNSRIIIFPFKLPLQASKAKEIVKSIMLGSLSSHDKSHQNYLCNAFAPKIKGIQGVAYLVLPWFEGNIAMLPSPYKGFVKGFLFTIKVGGFDRGFYLSQQLKELIYSEG